MRRALPIVLLLIIGALLWFVLSGGVGDDPSRVASDDPAAVEGDGTEEDGRTNRKRAGAEEPERKRVADLPSDPFLRRWPEVGQEDEQDPDLGAITGRVMVDTRTPAKDAVLEAGERGVLFARVHVPPDGRFTLKNVRPERSIAITARVDGRAPGGMDKLSVLAGETLDIGTVFVGAAFDPNVSNRVTVRVLDNEGAPLADAQVTASTVYYGSLLMLGHLEKQPGGTVVRDMTNADGEVVFEQIPPSGYDVFAEAEGYTFEVKQRVTIQDDTRGVFEFRLDPGLSISGIVTDEEGTPVDNARVGGMLWGQFTAVPGVSSDAEGKFELTGLKQGSYFVFAAKDELGGEDMQGIAAGTADLEIKIPLGGEVTLKVTDKATGEPILNFGARPFLKVPFAYLFAPLLEAETTDGVFTFRMPASDYGLELSANGYALETLPTLKIPSEAPVEIALVPAGVVHGRVVATSDGRPIPGAEIFVKKGGFPPTRVKDLSATSDENGEFTLDKLAPRQLSLWVSHVDHTEKLFEGVAPVVAVEGEEPTRVDFELSAGGSIEGVVYDENHVAVAGQMMNLAAGFDMFSARTALTDDEGRFAFENVPSERSYMISVGSMMPGQPGQSRSDVRVTDGAVTVVDFGIASGGRAVRGVVLRGEAPAANTSVSLVADDGSGGVVQKRTDDAGVFVFEGVQAGRYQVSVQRGGNQSITLVVREDADPDEIRMVLATAEILGTVVDDATGEALGGVYVECERIVDSGTTNLGRITQQWAGNDMTGGDGGFDIGGLADATYRVRAMREGYGSEVVDNVAVKDGEGPASLTIRLGPGGTVTGFIRNPQGTPITDASIEALNDKGQRLSIVNLVTSSSDGAYTYGGLAPGKYTFTATKQGFAPETKQITVTTGDALTVDFALLKGGRIDVSVTGSSSQPIEKAIVTLMTEGGQRVTHGMTLDSIFSTQANRTDSNGTFTIEGVAPGRYRVKMERTGQSVTSDVFEVFEGGTSAVEAQLPIGTDE